MGEPSGETRSKPRQNITLSNTILPNPIFGEATLGSSHRKITANRIVPAIRRKFFPKGSSRPDYHPIRKTLGPQSGKAHEQFLPVPSLQGGPSTIPSVPRSVRIHRESHLSFHAWHWFFTLRANNASLRKALRAHPTTSAERAGGQRHSSREKASQAMEREKENLGISGPWVLQEVIDLQNESYLLTVGGFLEFSPKSLIVSLDALGFVTTPN